MKKVATCLGFTVVHLYFEKKSLLQDLKVISSLRKCDRSGRAVV